LSARPNQHSLFPGFRRDALFKQPTPRCLKSGGAESEVAYKLLGYKENFGLENYIGVGLYPSFTRASRQRTLLKGNEHIKLLHVPIQKGRRFVLGMLRAAMREPGYGILPVITAP
jgi:hypothetical protein